MDLALKVTQQGFEPPVPCTRDDDPVKSRADAQRIRRDGSRGAGGESPGFLDPDKDCWDESGDWAGVARSGAIYVAGVACTGNETLFTMRYTSAMRRDYGPFDE